MGKELKTIEWEIYKHIKSRSKHGLWSSQEEIIGFLYAKGFFISKRTLRGHVRNIRECDIIQKIILTDYGKGYKLLSSAEQFDYVRRRKISILKSLKQCYKDAARFNNNDQMRLIFSPYERNFIESVLKEDEPKES